MLAFRAIRKPERTVVIDTSEYSYISQYSPQRRKERKLVNIVFIKILLCVLCGEIKSLWTCSGQVSSMKNQPPVMMEGVSPPGYDPDRQLCADWMSDPLR
jgi:hypothetical protein